MKRSYALLYALLAHTLPLTSSFGQVEFLELPTEVHVIPNAVYLIHIEFQSWQSPTQIQAYQGEHPDTSNPIPGARISGGADCFFDGRPTTENQKVWVRVCNDTGCGDTHTFNIIVKGNNGGDGGDGYDEGDVGDGGNGSSSSGPFADATDLEVGWVFSNWFGSLNMEFDPWIFHANHGWMYIWEESTAEEVYCYDLASDQWLFTAATSYPNLYSFVRQSWVFYFDGSAAPRQFVDLQSGDFFDLQ